MRLFSKFLVAFAFLGSVQTAYAIDCSSLNLNGNWTPAGEQALIRSPRSYRIRQSGCLLLVTDMKRNATWKIDLSGQHTVQVPPEVITANIEAGSPELAEDLAKTRITIADPWPQGSQYFGTLKSEVSLSAHERFPVSIRASFEAALQIDGDTINIYFRDAQIADITKGLPSGVDKSSFITGVNSALRFIVRPLRWSYLAVSLKRD